MDSEAMGCDQRRCSNAISKRSLNPHGARDVVKVRSQKQAIQDYQSIHKLLACVVAAFESGVVCDQMNEMRILEHSQNFRHKLGWSLDKSCGWPSLGFMTRR